MPAAYSYDLRERVVAAVGEGVSRRHAARQFKVGISTVIRWVARLAASGSCAAKWRRSQVKGRGDAQGLVAGSGQGRA